MNFVYAYRLSVESAVGVFGDILSRIVFNVGNKISLAFVCVGVDGRVNFNRVVGNIIFAVVDAFAAFQSEVGLCDKVIVSSSEKY